MSATAPPGIDDFGLPSGAGQFRMKDESGGRWWFGEIAVELLHAVIGQHRTRPVRSGDVREPERSHEGRRDLGGFVCGRDGAGLVGETGGVHDGVALDDGVEGQPAVEVPPPPQLPVGRHGAEVLELEGMDDLVRQGLPLVLGEIPQFSGPRLGDEPHGPGRGGVEPDQVVPNGAPEVTDVLVLVQEAEQSIDLRGEFRPLFGGAAVHIVSVRRANGADAQGGRGRKLPQFRHLFDERPELAGRA